MLSHFPLVITLFVVKSPSGEYALVGVLVGAFDGTCDGEDVSQLHTCEASPVPNPPVEVKSGLNA